ncbi:MAG: prolipoprotein diacylglyceryl transferase [Chloroflexi bacterium]|nr:prolipoprotein diacylglyceryl transferase [Chloroflexota bacterium]
MSIDQFGIHLGPLYIRFYGIILMLGVLAAAYLAERQATRHKMNTDFLWDSLFWMVIGGVVGARIWHILTPSPSLVAVGITTQYYLTHPLDAINLLNGGLGIPGAVAGGLLALYVMAKRRKQNFLDWVDVIAPALPLGQAIGRWGNFVNQELYGAPSNLPWAITIAPENRLPEFADQATYHPIFLYEALWSLGTVFLLLWLARKYSDRLKSGDLFLIYLISYPVIRILLDFLRLDASEVGGFNANQTLMAIVLVFAAVTLILRHRSNTKLAKG